MAKQKSQVEKFREAAKEAGTDDSEERFNATLKDMAKAPRDADKAGQKRQSPNTKRASRSPVPSTVVIGECSGTGVPLHQNPKSSCPGTDR